MRVFCAHLPTEVQSREIARLIEAQWNCPIIWTNLFRSVVIILLPYCDPSEIDGGMLVLLNQLASFRNVGDETRLSTDSKKLSEIYNKIVIAFLQVSTTADPAYNSLNYLS